jgi:hypothetical protein
MEAMKSKRGSTGEAFFTLFLMAQSAVPALGLTFTILHIARRLGASPLDAAIYAIVAAIAGAAIFLSQIMGTVVDSLHERIDTIVDELGQLRREVRDHDRA